MHDADMVQGHLAWLQDDVDGESLINFDRNFLAPGQQVVLGEGVPVVERARGLHW